ncbi:MAG: hypothetical protein M3304_03170 [Actinomycetota bacterium]|nr:hypothetical protein [Actinomycetota bacterium]
MSAATAIGSAGGATLIVASGFAFVAIKTLTAQPAVPEPGFHGRSAHENFVAYGTEVAAVLVFLVVGVRQLFTRLHFV